MHLASNRLCSGISSTVRRGAKARTQQPILTSLQERSRLGKLSKEVETSKSTSGADLCNDNQPIGGMTSRKCIPGPLWNRDQICSSWPRLLPPSVRSSKSNYHIKRSISPRFSSPGMDSLTQSATVDITTSIHANRNNSGQTSGEVPWPLLSDVSCVSCITVSFNAGANTTQDAVIFVCNSSSIFAHV